MAELESPTATANRLIDYHAPISRALTAERTSLESASIWSRLGRRFRVEELERLLWRDRSLFEYRAFILPTSQFSVHRETMRRYPGPSGGRHAYVRRYLRENPRFRRYVLQRLRDEGPLPTRVFDDRSAVGWQTGGWNDEGRNTSMMLEVLWAKGEVMIAGRAGQERVWEPGDEEPAVRRTPAARGRGGAEPPRRTAACARHLQGHAVRVDVRGRSTPRVAASAGAARAGGEGRSRDRGRAPGRAVGARKDPRPGVPPEDRPAVTVRPVRSTIGPVPRSSSGSDSGSRSTSRRRSASTATSCSRSSTATGLFGRLDPVHDRVANVLRVQGVFAEEDAPAAAWPAIRKQLDELAAWVGADGVELPKLPKVWR